MDQNNSNQNNPNQNNATPNNAGSVPPENKDTQDSPLLSSENAVANAEAQSAAPADGTKVLDELKAEPTPAPAEVPAPEVKKEETPVDPLAALRPPAGDPTKPKKKGAPLLLIIVFLIFSFLCSLLIAGWYFQNQLQVTKTANETPQPIKETIIIGTNATDPPMESLNKEGALVGYDIDLGYRLANEMGVKAEFKNIDWDELFKELLDKKIDMIMASVTITDERKKIYAFSEPYINAGQVIISRKDSPITSVDKLEGKKIAVQKDTTNEKEAYKHTAKNLVLVYSEYNDIAKAVSLGSAEAALSDLTIAKGLIGNYENVRITSDPFTNEYYGIVMRKEDKDLQKKVNDALTVLRVNGIIADLKQKWLD